MRVVKKAEKGVAAKHKKLKSALDAWFSQADFTDVEKVTGLDIWGAPEAEDIDEDDKTTASRFEVLQEAKKVWDSYTTDVKFKKYHKVTKNSAEQLVEDAKSFGKDNPAPEKESDSIPVGMNFQSDFTSDEEERIQDDVMEHVANMVAQGFTSGDLTGEENPEYAGWWNVFIKEDEHDEEERNAEVAKNIRNGNTSGFYPTYTFGANVWKSKAKGGSVTMGDLNSLISEINASGGGEFSLGGAYGQQELWAKDKNGGSHRVESGSKKDIYQALIKNRYNKKYNPNYASEISEDKVDEVLKHYMIAALWSSTDSDNEDEPFDANYSISDIDADSVASMRRDVVKFLTENKAVLDFSKLEDEQIGHDFWLTRHGHGAGFWDRGLGKSTGDKLTAAAKAFPESSLYAVGGKVKLEHLSPIEKKEKGGEFGKGKLNWRLGTGFPKYYYGYNNGAIYATEENNITPDLQIKDIELVFQIKAKNFIGERDRAAAIKEMIEIFPELDKSEVVSAVHFIEKKEKGGSVDNFSAHTDLWFDEMVDYIEGEKELDPNYPKLVELAQKEATKENLEKFVEVMEGCSCSKPELKDKIITHIRNIKKGAYKSEFKNQYGGKAKQHGKVSAASSFFDMFLQAVNYVKKHENGGVVLGESKPTEFILSNDHYRLELVAGNEEFAAFFTKDGAKSMTVPEAHQFYATSTDKLYAIDVNDGVLYTVDRNGNVLNPVASKSEKNSAHNVKVLVGGAEKHMTTNYPDNKYTVAKEVAEKFPTWESFELNGVIHARKSVMDKGGNVEKSHSVSISFLYKNKQQIIDMLEKELLVKISNPMFDVADKSITISGLTSKEEMLLTAKLEKDKKVVNYDSQEEMAKGGGLSQAQIAMKGKGAYKYGIYTVSEKGEELGHTFHSDNPDLDTYSDDVPVSVGSNQVVRLIETKAKGGHVAGQKRDSSQYANSDLIAKDFTIKERNKIAEELVRRAWKDWGAERVINLAKASFRWWGNVETKTVDDFIHEINEHSEPIFGEADKYRMLREFSEYYFYDSYANGGAVKGSELNGYFSNDGKTYVNLEVGKQSPNRIGKVVKLIYSKRGDEEFEFAEVKFRDLTERIKFNRKEAKDAPYLTFNPKGLTAREIKFLIEVEKLYFAGHPINLDMFKAALDKIGFVKAEKGAKGLLDAWSFWSSMYRPFYRDSYKYPIKLSSLIQMTTKDNGKYISSRNNETGDFKSGYCIKLRDDDYDMLQGLTTYWEIVNNEDLYLKYDQIIGSRFIAVIDNDIPELQVAAKMAKGGSLMTKEEAIEAAIKEGVDFSKDVHAQSHGHFLTELAKKVGYRKPKNANGSTGRYFFQHLERIWDKQNAKKPKIHATYNEYGYEILDSDNNVKYSAGNNPDSSSPNDTLPLDDPKVIGVARIHAFADISGREIAKEEGYVYTGAHYEAREDDDIDEFEKGGGVEHLHPCVIMSKLGGNKGKFGRIVSGDTKKEEYYIVIDGESKPTLYRALTDFATAGDKVTYSGSMKYDVGVILEFNKANSTVLLYLPNGDEKSIAVHQLKEVIGENDILMKRWLKKK